MGPALERRAAWPARMMIASKRSHRNAIPIVSAPPSDRVLDEGGGAILAECGGQCGPEGVPCEGTDYGASDTRVSSADHRTAGGADRGAGDGSRDDAGAEPKGHRTAGS